MHRSKAFQSSITPKRAGTSGHANTLLSPIQHHDETFAATVVPQLVGKGRVSSTTRSERWLPGVVPNGNNIRLRELGNHTSGPYDYLDKASAARLISDPARVRA
jgi:Beta-lactamase